MPVRSSTYIEPDLSMNHDEFWNYLKNRYDEKFANFICNDLNIITPSVLTVLTLKELNDAAKAVYPNLKSPSIEYYSCDPKDKNATHELQQTIMALIKILKNELTEKNRKKKKT